MSANGTRPEQLKILICLLYYVPHRTGLTIHVQRVAEELVRRGHEVTVLTARYSNDLPRDETVHNGVRIVRLWAPIRVSRGMIMPAYPWAALGLLWQHDVVSIHTPMMETALISVLASLTRRKVVITHHGDLVLPENRLNRWISSMVFAMYKFTAKRAGRLIAYSHDYADHSYYLQPFRDKVSVIYPPVKMPLPDAKRVADFRARWSRQGGPIIGYAGRFVDEKRPDLAIRALQVITEKYPEARLIFAGDYDIPYEDTWQRHQDLRQQYSEHLIFLGLIDDMQFMADFYAACDVLVLPSETECFALVQVEAMLCGTPVVMTDIPGGRVPVTVTGMGKLAQSGDWQSIGAALVDVLDHSDTFHRSREHIEACFSFQETVDRYEKHLRNHASARHG